MVEKGFFDMEEARANRSSGSLVVQNVSNYGLISDKVVSQMMRQSVRPILQESSKHYQMLDEPSFSEVPST